MLYPSKRSVSEKVTGLPQVRHRHRIEAHQPGAGEVGRDRVIRDRLRLTRKVRTLTAQTQLSKRVLVALPFIMFLVLSLLNPKYVAVYYNTVEGQVALCAAAATLLAGV